MAWPRNKNPRSSARPGAPERVTATPAPDAEQPPGSAAPGPVEHGNPREPGASPEAAPGESDLPDSAHRADPPGGPDDSPDDDFDGTAGLVYEADSPADEGLAIFGAATPAGPAEPAAEPPAQPAAGPAPVAASPDENAGQQADAPEAGTAGDSKRRPFRGRIHRLASVNLPDDGQPQITVRDLPPDVQMRFWRVRATIMAATGLLFLLLTKSWVIALTLAVLAGVADTFYRARYAANYANGASQVGARRRTRRQLARMRRAGYFALDARPIPNSREFIDHLVVGPTGVYAIDSEKWDSKLPIRTWNGKKLYHGPESQKPRLEHAAWEAGQASEILSGALGTDIKVRPALAIYGPKIPWDIATIRGVDVFTGSALRKYLKRRGRMSDDVPRLTREQVRTIYDTASRMLPDVAPAQAATPVG